MAARKSWNEKWEGGDGPGQRERTSEVELGAGNVGDSYNKAQQK